MTKFTDTGKRFRLTSPTLAPNASAFLWNASMMMQVTCRGFAVSQFMQPEPAKYAHTPVLAAKTFMQPEHPTFTHHPGRFFYIRDNESGTLFSAPFEPVKSALDSFEFMPGLTDIQWRIVKDDIEVNLTLSLAATDVLEIWQVQIKNLSKRPRDISLVPYFPIGYSSWMNMSADYHANLNAIVAKCISPYQKVEDYFKNKHDKDLTYFISDRAPNSWECAQQSFEGDSGLHNPEALQTDQLKNGDCLYEIPACIMKLDLELKANDQQGTTFLFGPAKDLQEVERIRQSYLIGDKIKIEQHNQHDNLAGATNNLTLDSPDDTFNHFVNYWLPRQVYYHGDTNRLSTDPQTRNYLQDAMGMVYLKPSYTRAALCHALKQQKMNGQMPDGILLNDTAELKYINQIPHTDHCIWLVICLQAYLNETNDYSVLEEQIAFSDNDEPQSVFNHIKLSMDWLLQARDERGLSLIAQGDWCDPMNMVGYKGKGVSGWLTEALSYALQCWASICDSFGETTQLEKYRQAIVEINQKINTHFWDGNWYARGITDDNIRFGTQHDIEGKVFLNSQSWAFLCGAANPQQIEKIHNAIRENLDTPFGPMLFAPAFTKMRDDIGRVTQKFPGAAENGSVYNHASAFYAASLYHVGEPDTAFDTIRKMIAGPELDDISKRGQLPIYIPNYYRGAYYQHPRTAGKSSQLFNTGTGAWVLRIAHEQLVGLKGCKEGLLIQPQPPSSWASFSARKRFRGANIELIYTRSGNGSKKIIRVNGQVLSGCLLSNIQKNETYLITVEAE
jgi:cellobionic acid phosphorylase